MQSTQWLFQIIPFNKVEMPLKYIWNSLGGAQLYCPSIGRNADDYVVVSVSALYVASADSYAGKTRVY